MAVVRKASCSSVSVACARFLRFYSLLPVTLSLQLTQSVAWQLHILFPAGIIPIPVTPSREGLAASCPEPTKVNMPTEELPAAMPARWRDKWDNRSPDWTN
ncbi:hypothetical protein D918_09328 [Trichuris suis]|nr:hypothetical protein D918_09328 [Trichuris suis]